ncbi:MULTISPECIES: hypothetical protein [Bacillaceae]|uniref:YokE-like PH domain-containing protein n=1 Tax=Evansella alkalicola TaxID=745819 RepID=A0ABS6JR65_9BACI|nr:MULTISPECIES: hypothetical protein [Bacillaceae]MBU9721025.1 hypothetical protein [Bacillus alkalicola]
MNLISQHPYVTTERVVTPLDQKNIETNCVMKLYDEKIVTAKKEFLLHTVIDMSFKQIRGEEGFLYLHTNQGVFSYNVKENPNEFIKVFKEVKNS